MPQNAELLLISRIHSGESQPAKTVILDKSGPDKVAKNITFNLSESLSLLGMMNESHGVLVNTNAGTTIPTVAQCFETAKSYATNRLPAAYTLETVSSLPDFKTTEPHYWKVDKWVENLTVGAFSAGFRIMAGAKPLQLKLQAPSKNTSGFETLIIDFLVVVQGK